MTCSLPLRDPKSERYWLCDCCERQREPNGCLIFTIFKIVNLYLHWVRGKEDSWQLHLNRELCWLCINSYFSFSRQGFCLRSVGSSIKWCKIFLVKEYIVLFLSGPCADMTVLTVGCEDVTPADTCSAGFVCTFWGWMIRTSVNHL